MDLFSTSLKSQELGDLGGAVQDSMSDTISQVNDIDLGEAKSELAEGIDDAMGKMGEGMEFALQALEGGDAETALKTMEMLESTMDMAIDAIPKEEFMDFSKLKLLIIYFIVIFLSLFSLLNFINVKENSILSKKVNLGLDLQGGSYMLLEVDSEPVLKQKLQEKSLL